MPAFAAPLFLVVAHAAPSLMPLPAKMTVNSGRLTIDSSFQIAAAGYRDAMLDAAMRRTEARIFRQFGFATAAPRRTALTIDCRGSRRAPTNRTSSMSRPPARGSRPPR